MVFYLFQHKLLKMMLFSVIESINIGIKLWRQVGWVWVLVSIQTKPGLGTDDGAIYAAAKLTCYLSILISATEPDEIAVIMWHCYSALNTSSGSCRSSPLFRIAFLPLFVYSQCMSEQGVPRFWVPMTQHAPFVHSSLKELHFFSANTGHDKHLPIHNIIVPKSCESGFVISPPV